MQTCRTVATRNHAVASNPADRAPSLDSMLAEIDKLSAILIIPTYYKPVVGACGIRRLDDPFEGHLKTSQRDVDWRRYHRCKFLVTHPARSI
jgi:hypothetical protein